MNETHWQQVQDKDRAERIAQLESFIVNRGCSKSEAINKRDHVSSKPYLFILETTSVCNLKCVMCPHGNDEAPKPEHLKQENLENITAFVQTAESIQLTGLGEPLLSPMFWKALNTFSPLVAAKTKVISNGVLLNSERVKQLLNSNLRQISFSIDSCRPEVYAKIRGTKLENILSNISKLMEMRNERKSHPMLIELNLTVMKENVEELEDYIDFASKLGADKVCFQFLNEGYSNGDTTRWRVTKGSWTYIYAEQSIQNFPELFKANLDKAIWRAKTLGLQLELDSMKPYEKHQILAQPRGQG